MTWLPWVGFMWIFLFPVSILAMFIWILRGWD